MYAIFKAGGKQYKVKAGDTVRVEKLEKDLGSEFDVSEVLYVGGEKVYVGEPTVDKAKVTVVVTQQTKAPKVIVFKKKRRQGYRRLKGHRQQFTELFVKSITTPDGDTDATDKKAKVIDHVANTEKKEKARLDAIEAKRQSKKTGGDKEAVTKKKTKKKTATKKASSKKTAAKKTTTKKKTAKKATSKKTTKKKTT